MSEQHCNAYRELRSRVTDLLESAGPEAGNTPAPATPEWTVHDLLAHLVGVCDDVQNGRLDGVASDEWTARQVDARRDASTADILDEWDARGPGFEDLLVEMPTPIAGQALLDAFTHESDMRHALGAAGIRDGDAVDLSWEFLVGARTNGGAPALRFVTDQGDVVAGTGEQVATIQATRFELLRACTGRRSESEIAAYGWKPEPQPELLIAAPFFRLRTTPLGE
jgi:uncharacterized protein (TIGR03083 family)